MKKLLALALALVMALTLVSCGESGTSSTGSTGGNTGSSNLKVGVFYYAFSDIYISTVRSNMDAKLEELGVTYQNFDGNNNQANQTD